MATEPRDLHCWSAHASIFQQPPTFMYIYIGAKTQMKEDTVPSEEMNYDMIMFVKPLWQSAN